MDEYIDLSGVSPSAKRHKAVLTIDARQGGVPDSFLGPMVVPYHNLKDADLAAIRAGVANMAGVLGRKGSDPGEGDFDIEMTLEVDGKKDSAGKWKNRTRDQMYAFEAQVCNVWLDMGKQAYLADSADGKVGKKK